MTTTQRIRAMYNQYQSGPIAVSRYMIEAIKKNDCCCSSCGASIFDLDDFPVIRKRMVYCEECERRLFYSACPLCDDYYETPKPRQEILIISKEAIEEYDMGITPGFYKVKRYPITFGNIVTGFEGLYASNIQLIREVDINSMLRKLYPFGAIGKISADECCADCLQKYTGRVKLINNYVDNAYGRSRIAFERKIIKQGK